MAHLLCYGCLKVFLITKINVDIMFKIFHPKNDR